MIKFNKFAVVDTATGSKARVHYSLDNRTDGRKVVTLYAKDYQNTLANMFTGSYENNTDIMTDYFEKGTVRLFEDHPLYLAARTRAESLVKQPSCEGFSALTNGSDYRGTYCCTCGKTESEHTSVQP